MRVVLGFMLLLAGCGGERRLSGDGSFSRVECAPFARQMSGIALFGEAHTWWKQANGRYERGNQPVEGGVLVFRQSSRLPSGHVSVVARQISERTILVTQANWVNHRITSNEPLIDVSPDNDWSQVKVWWAPIHAMGGTIYATYGFIGPGRSRARDVIVADQRSP